MNGKLSQENIPAGNVKLISALRYDWSFEFVEDAVL